MNRESTTERPKLLIVGGNGSTFARFEKAWPHLEERFRPALVEIAGQGNRSIAPLRSTLAGFGEDLAAELTRAASGERVVCYGHGIGGLLLARAVRQAPEIAARLILHAPVGAHLMRRRFPRLMTCGPLRRLVRSMLASPILGPVLTRPLFAPGSSPSTRHPEGVYGGHVGMSWADRRAFADGYRQARSFGALFARIDPVAVFDGLEELSLPVTLLWGGRDPVLRPDQLPAWAEALPAATVIARLVPHWRHYPYLDHPVEFAAILAECAGDDLPERPLSLDEMTHFRPCTKAGRLASMRRAGLPVPNGWWIPVAALENGSAASLFSALPCDQCYAVRSSAVGEDQAGQTAAGVYESELGVAPSDLLEACRRVVRSGRPEYFERSQGNPSPRIQSPRSPDSPRCSAPPCDVLVQEMAPSEAGGVAWVRALGIDLEMAPGAFDRAVAGTARVLRASLSTLGPPWTEVPSGADKGLPAGLTKERLWKGLWPHLQRAHALFDTGTLDMEWCYDGRAGFRVLQARPVGELHAARRLLSAANLREVTPPDPSPFLVGTFEQLSPLLPRYYARLDRGVAPWHEPFAVTVAGHSFINADFYAALMDRWGLPRSLVSRGIGGSLPSRSLRPWRLLASLPVFVRLAADWTCLYPGSEETLALLRAALEAATELPSLAGWFVDAIRLLVETNLRITAALSAAVPLWPGRAPEVVTAVMASELRAAQAGDDRAQSAFAARWGHRGEYETDPAFPRGDEGLCAPDAAVMPRPALPDPLALLPRPLRRLPMLTPRHLLAHREWFRDGAMRLWSAFRARMLAEAGAIVRAGFLDAPSDIWKLTPREIRSLLACEWRTLVARRQALPAEDSRRTAIETELFWSDTLAPLGASLPESRLPLVAGQVSGPAVVARTPSEALAILASLPAGTRRPILLATAVDPGWLSVFVQVAGVATELGGRLSHAATLLRELRLPSVLNLPGVTRTARTGEIIQLRVPPGEVTLVEG